MRRTCLAVLAAILATAPEAARANPDGHRLVIVNHTKADLLELYTSPIEAKSWGADQLGSLRIAAGGRVTVNLRNPEGACVYDLMLVFADGEKVRRREDVCVASTLVVTEPAGPDLPSV